jgi:hypothetical protein
VKRAALSTPLMEGRLRKWEKPPRDSEVRKRELKWKLKLVLTLLCRRNKRHAPLL